MNKRFIFQDCKFTLKPDQRLHHYQGEPTDEGYSYRSFELVHLSSGPDKGEVVAHLVSGGRDCDGEHRHYTDLMLAPDGSWNRIGGHEYDQYAQMMNY